MKTTNLSIQLLSRTVLCLVLVSFTSACATGGPSQHQLNASSNVQVQATDASVDTDSQSAEAIGNAKKVDAAIKVAGAVVGTLTTVYLIKEFIEEDLLPTAVALGLVLIVANSAIDSH